MNNNLFKHEKADKIKWIITFAAIFLLGVFVLAACTNGFTDANPYGWFGERNDTSDTAPADEADVINEMGVEIHNTSLMKLSATKMMFASPAAMSTRASGVTLTATILPNTTTNKAVDWSVEFVDPSSSWASGKTASNYVSVVPTSDGALTANVTALAGFGGQIKIVVTARSNPEATAYCLVDYGQRLADNATVTFSNDLFATNQALASTGVQSVESVKAGNWQAMNAAYGRSTFSFTPSYKSDYTKANASENVTVYIKPTDAFYNTLKAQGIANSTNDWSAISTEYIGELYEGLVSVQLIPTDGLSTTVLENVDKFNAAVVANTEAYDFEIKISAATTYETKDYIIQCHFNRNGAAFSANSVNLNSESIVL
ncbi:MAG: hypothetical protein IJ426_06175 [Clostridia bacterium]|nr:hypothetical protein [Clostridia bacterium]